MQLVYVLSMPSVGSWNGQWSGKDRVYAVVRSYRGKAAMEKARTIASCGYYSYDFGDGWRAGIDVKEVSAKEAKWYQRNTCGFCGYEWMITEIEQHGRIIPLNERKYD